MNHCTLSKYEKTLKLRMGNRMPDNVPLVLMINVCYLILYTLKEYNILLCILNCF